MDEKMMITIDFDKLYDILCDYLEVEDRIHNLLVVMKILEEYYNGTEMVEIYAVVSLLTYQIEMIRQEIRKAHNRVDEFLLKK